MKKILILICFFCVKGFAQCDTVTNLTVTNITTISANINFTASGTAYSYYIAVRDTITNVTAYSTTTTNVSVTATGLSPGRRYQVMVMSFCVEEEGTSVDSTFKKFTTQAELIYTPMSALGYRFKYLMSDSGFTVPYGPLSVGRGAARAGSIKVSSSDNNFYGWDGATWKPFTALDTAGLRSLFSMTNTGNYPDYNSETGAINVPYGWNTAGNTGITSSHRIGPINNTHLRLITNDVERVRVDSLGSVYINGITNGVAYPNLLNIRSISAPNNPVFNIGTNSNNSTFMTLKPNNNSGFTVDGSSSNYGPLRIAASNVDSFYSIGLYKAMYFGTSDGFRFNIPSGTPVSMFSISANSASRFMVRGTGTVNIGDTTGMSNTSLSVTSTTKPAVLPRMTGAQMTAISSPVIGSLLYNTDSSSYVQYNGSWVKFGGGGGDGGTVTSVGAGYLTTTGGSAITGSGNVGIDSAALFGLALRKDDSTIFASAYQNSMRWGLTGNSINSNYKLGSTNNSSVRFYTNDSLRMTLDSLGNLAINNLAATGTKSSFSVRHQGTPQLTVNQIGRPGVILGDTSGYVLSSNFTNNAPLGKGALPAPRWTTAERNNILFPADGLLIYNKTLKYYQVFDSTNTTWTTLAPGSEGGNVDSVLGKSPNVIEIQYNAFTDSILLETPPLTLTGEVLGSSINDSTITTTLADTINNDHSFLGEVTLQGDVKTNLTASNSNFWVQGSNTIQAATTNARALFGGTGLTGTGTNGRGFFTGSSSSKLTAGYNHANVLIGRAPLTEADSLNHNWLANAAVTTIGTVTGGGGTVSNTASLFVGAPATVTVSDSNYSLYADGTSKINGYLTVTAPGDADSSGLVPTTASMKKAIALALTAPPGSDIAEQTNAASITFTGTTAPSGTVTNTYRWNRHGKLITVRFNFKYAAAGTAISALSFTLPGDLPVPEKPTGFTGSGEISVLAASVKLYTLIGTLGTSYGIAGIIWDGTNYNLHIKLNSSLDMKFGWCMLQYFEQ